MPEPENKLVFEVLINATVEEVWHELVKTDEPQQAFFNTVLHTDGLKPGGKMRMRTINGKYTGVVGTVLEFDPPRRYVTTFRFTNFDDPECRVAHDVIEEPGGQVRYRLTVEDLPVGTKTAKQMTQGGTMIVNTMKAVCEDGKPSFGTRMLFVLFRLFEPFSPKASRSENWPL